MKRRYLGKTNENIKQGNDYYIVIHHDIIFGRTVAFVHTTEKLNNCIGAINYNEEEWSTVL